MNGNFNAKQNIFNMYKLILAMLSLLISLPSYSQSREDSLKNVIGNFFTSMKKNDINGFSKIMDSGSELKTVMKYKDSLMVHTSSYAEFQSMMNEPLAGEWEEKMKNYTYLHDELMSTIWTEYDFIFNGKLSHTGVNQFTLMRNPESKEFGWKIISIIDTRYPKGKGDLSNDKKSENESGQIDTLLNKWHQAAAKANESDFFDLMSDSCIYKGTDKTERWTKKEFHSFAKPFFDKGKAWDFKPLERHIRLDDNLQTAWFDERLDTWMGECKSSGILKKENGVWKLWLYDLSVTIDNDKIKKFIKLSSK